MKNKFLMLSLLVCSFFTACSSDDDGGNNNDPIVGTWEFTMETLDEEEQEIDDCELKTNYIFKSNNEAVENYYYFWEECVLETGNGTWSKGEGNAYTATFNYQEDDESTGSETYEFELSGNQLILMDGEYKMIYTKK